MNSQQSHTCHQHGLCIRWRAVAPSFPLCWGAWPSLNQQYLTVDDRQALQVRDHWWERTWLCGSLWTNTWRSCTMHHHAPEGSDLQQISWRNRSLEKLMINGRALWTVRYPFFWMDAMSNLDQVVIFIEVDKYKTKQNKISIKQNKTKQNKTKHTYSIPGSPNSNDFSMHCLCRCRSWLFGPLASPAVMIPTRQLEQKVPVKDCPTFRDCPASMRNIWWMKNACKVEGSACDRVRLPPL